MSDFKELKDTVIRYAGQASGGDFEKLVTVTMNGVYRRLLDMSRVPHEHREFSLTTVANTKKYGMPLYVRRVTNIEDTDNKRSIWATTDRAYDKAYPGYTSTGTPSEAFALGVRGVQAYPASDGTLSVVSDVATDTGANYKVRVTGFNTSGVLVTELVTMDGTTAVDTSNSYDSTLGIERVTKSPASGITFAGNITVKDDDSNTISIIPPWWMSPDYEWIQFRPIPGEAVTYTIRAEMRKPPLVNDTDWPEIDQEYHDLLVWGTTKDLLPALGKGPTGDRHRATFKDRMGEFLAFKDPTENHIWVFSNVQSNPIRAHRGPRPLITGVDVI